MNKSVKWEFSVIHSLERSVHLIISLENSIIFNSNGTYVTLNLGVEFSTFHANNTFNCSTLNILKPTVITQANCFKNNSFNSFHN